MNETMAKTKQIGQQHTVLTTDLHMVGSVGNLMADSGLEELLQSASGSVQAMLSGKKFPQNVRALRMVAEELLCGILESDGKHIGQHSQLMNILEDKAAKSRTAKVWLDNLIKLVFIIMLFVRAE